MAAIAAARVEAMRVARNGWIARAADIVGIVSRPTRQPQARAVRHVAAPSHRRGAVGSLVHQKATGPATQRSLGWSARRKHPGRLVRECSVRAIIDGFVPAARSSRRAASARSPSLTMLYRSSTRAGRVARRLHRHALGMPARTGLRTAVRRSRGESDRGSPMPCKPTVLPHAWPCIAVLGVRAGDPRAPRIAAARSRAARRRVRAVAAMTNIEAPIWRSHGARIGRQ